MDQRIETNGSGQSPFKSPLHDGLRADANTQRDHHLKNCENYLVQYSVTQWLDHCIETPEGSAWDIPFSSQVREMLMKDKVFNSKGEWKALQLDKNLGEDATYDGTETMTDAVCNAAQKLWKAEKPTEPALMRQSVYQTTPTQSSVSATISPRLKPDGRYTTLRNIVDPGKPVARRSPRLNGIEREPGWSHAFQKGKLISGITSECTGLAEFKLDKSGRKSNERQLVGGAAHLLYNDPTRRHVYGYTMEGEFTRFWRFDRGMISVSEEFNCHTDSEYLIRFFLFLSFASEEAIGYDASVRQVTTGDTTYFIYEADGKYYRTINAPLAEDNAFYIISRGVRTWEVSPCKFDGTLIVDQKTGRVPIHVLKDCWQFEDVSDEKAMQEKIKAGLPPSEAGKLDPYLLTILACVDVRLSNKRVDKTVSKAKEATPIAFQHFVIEKEKLHGDILALARTQQSQDLRQSQKQQQDPVRKDLSSQLYANPDVFYQHHVKVHRRLVFAERCTPFYELDTAQKLLAAAKGCVSALKLFRRAGYVHRDISGGNCLLYEKQGSQNIFKISDLEHCRKYSDVTGVHDPISVSLLITRAYFSSGELMRIGAQGTFENLAIEACEGRFRYWEGTDTKARKDMFLLGPQDSVGDESSYHYHYLHDVESTWWLTILQWLRSVVIAGEGSSLPPHAGITEPISDVQFKLLVAWEPLLEEWFSGPSTHSPGHRYELIMSNFSKLRQTLHFSHGERNKPWWPDSVKLALGPICTFGDELRVAYSALRKQTMMPINNHVRYPESAFDDTLYDDIISSIDEATEILGEATVNIRPITIVILTEAHRRNKARDEEAKRAAAEKAARQKEEAERAKQRTRQDQRRILEEEAAETGGSHRKGARK